MHERKAGWEDGSVIGAGELTPLPTSTCWEKQTSGQKKLLGHMTGGGTTREVQVYPGITGFDRDTAAKGREGCSSGPSVIPGEY